MGAFAKSPFAQAEACSRPHVELQELKVVGVFSMVDSNDISGFCADSLRESNEVVKKLRAPTAHARFPTLSVDTECGRGWALVVEEARLCCRDDTLEGSRGTALGNCN